MPVNCSHTKIKYHNYLFHFPPYLFFNNQLKPVVGTTTIAESTTENSINDWSWDARSIDISDAL